MVLGFASLAVGRKRALFVTFGSSSLGIPSALSRVFARVSCSKGVNAVASCHVHWNRGDMRQGFEGGWGA